jgi:EmrB/QacA subfamily drug resistance transporter
VDTEVVYRRRWLILAVLSLCLVISGLDALVIAMAVPSVQADLSATVGQMQWAVDAYTLTFGGLLLLSGGLADRFGHKRLLLTGLVVMLAFSVAAAFAGSAGALITFRAGMGLGAALIMPATLAIIKFVFPPEEQAKAISVWSGAAGLGIPLGPVVGGLLLEHFWWGSIFLLNVPVIGIALAGAVVLIPVWRSEQGRPLDVAGAVLSVLGLVTLVYGLIEVPRYGWGSASTVLALLLGVLLLAGFVAWEARAGSPMLPLSLFGNRRFSGAAVALTCQALAMFGSLFVLTQYFQLARGHDPLPAGVRLLAICTLIISSQIAPQLVARVGDRFTISAGLAIIAVGAFVMSRAAVDAEGTVLWGLAVMGFGIGLSIPPSVDGILAGAPDSQSGTASAVNDTTLQVGGAIGVAVLGSVMTTSYRNALPDLGTLPGGVGTAVRDSIGGAREAAGSLGAQGADVLRSASQAFGHGLDAAMLTAAVVAAIGAVAAAVMLPGKTATAPAVEKEPVPARD